MAGRYTEHVATKGNREIWRWEIVDPAGVTQRMWRGREYADVDGVRRLTPEEPFFHGGELEARQWLSLG